MPDEASRTQRPLDDYHSVFPKVVMGDGVLGEMEESLGSPYLGPLNGTLCLMPPQGSTDNQHHLTGEEMDSEEK